jgi:hypothetical protein
VGLLGGLLGVALAVAGDELARCGLVWLDGGGQGLAGSHQAAGKDGRGGDSPEDNSPFEHDTLRFD